MGSNTKQKTVNQKIIDKANSLGFQKVGFSKADFHERSSFLKI